MISESESKSELKVVKSISTIDIPDYRFDLHEKTVLHYYLQEGKRYLMVICDPKTREEEERLRQYRELIEMSKGQRSVRKPHQTFDIFTAADVTEYYRDSSHRISDEERYAMEVHLKDVRPTRFYMTLDHMIEVISSDIKAGKYGKLNGQELQRYQSYSNKRLTLELERAFKRLSVRGFAYLFPGTPRFKMNAISIDIPKVQAAIRELLRPLEEATSKIVPEKGLLHDVKLSPDKPPFYSDDKTTESVEAIVDAESDERDRAVENIAEDYDSVHPIFRLEDLTEEQRFVIEHAQANNNCVNLQWVLNIALKSPLSHTYTKNNLYQRLYRASLNLEKKGIVSIKKGAKSPIFTGIDQNNKPREWSDGLLWIVLDQSKIHAVTVNSAASPRLGAPEKTDLIKGYYKIPTREITPKPASGARRDPYAIPKRCGSLRKSAIYFLQGVKTLDYEENRRDRVEKRHSQGPYHDMRVLMDRFRIYQDESLRKIIRLMNTITGEIIGFDYATRFNDYAKGIERLKAYEYAQDKSLELFDEAVFVTLTTDPKRFPNLWKANRHSSKAWNTFMQILTVEMGDRVHRQKYVAAFEYTKTGLLHIHALIFGRRYLHSSNAWEERHWISEKWDNSCHQASIVEAYGLKRVECADGHKEWQWYTHDDTPHDAGKMSGGEYLKKYLKKCMMAISDRYQDPASTLAPYWAENKRFWSCSRSLMKKTEPDVADHPSPVRYDFLSIDYGTDVVEAERSGAVDRIAYKRYDPERDGTPECEEVVT